MLDREHAYAVALNCDQIRYDYLGPGAYKMTSYSSDSDEERYFFVIFSYILQGYIFNSYL